jgi:hypothetical protein
MGQGVFAPVSSKKKITTAISIKQSVLGTYSSSIYQILVRHSFCCFLAQCCAVH